MLLEDGYECCGRTECLHECRMMEMEQWFSGEKPENPENPHFQKTLGFLLPLRSITP